MRRERRRGAMTSPVINITPLIDVVFVILIAFIMVAPFLERDQVQLAPAGPTHGTISMSDVSSLHLYVRADNTIVLCGTPISLDELFTKVQAVRAKFPKARMQVFHDKRAQFGVYQQIKNTLEAVGFEEIDIVLLPA